MCTAAPTLGLLGARLAMLFFLGHLAFLQNRCDGDDTTDWPSALDATALRDLPSVHSITICPVHEPSRRIIHIANEHHLPRAHFKTYVSRAFGATLSDEELDAEYERKMEEVEAVQADQLLFLQALVKRHGIRSLYFEGLPPFEIPRDLYKSNKGEFATTFGAGGRLFLSGELATIRGIEPNFSSILSSHANKGERSWAAFNEEREREIVKTLLSGDPVAIVILGAAHDLSDHVRKLSHGSCEYIKVETRVLWERSPRIGEPLGNRWRARAVPTE